MSFVDFLDALARLADFRMRMPCAGYMDAAQSPLPPLKLLPPMRLPWRPQLPPPPSPKRRQR
jgi:hypothetical protein